MSALQYLDSLQGSGIRPGLERMRGLLRPLGNPHRRVPAVIVAGTNGKGSTSAMLESILRTAGLRTGLYTSPHLVDIRERWQIGGEPISAERLEASAERLRSAARASGIDPTYFEALTVVAFEAFAAEKCDVAVIEVGMGGRLDATNVVRPLAAVLTPIGFDHQEFLGNTLRKIAGEKAGVIHRGAVVLTSNDEPAVLDVIARRARRLGNEVIVVRGEHPAPLAGTFQRRNAALAAETARALRTHFPAISEEVIRRGIAATRWRGRLEHLTRSGKEIWIDGGHNSHAAHAIAPAIEELVPQPRVLVAGIMSDKDVRRFGEILFPLFARIVACEPYPPRSVAAEALAALAREIGVPAEPVKDPAAAIENALRGPERGVVIAGSLYLAGAAVALFER